MKSKDLFEHLSGSSTGTLLFGDTRMVLLDIQAGFWSIRRQIEALIGAKLTGSVLQQAGTNGGVSFAASFGKAKKPTEQSQYFESCLQAYQLAGFGKFEIDQADWPIGQLLIRAADTFEAWMMQRHVQQVEGPVCSYTAGVLVGFVNVVSDRQDIVCIERHCQALGDDFCEFELLPVREVSDQPVVAFTPDPTLGRQLNLLEMLFERMPMGIALIDRDYKLIRTNPTWAAFIDEYTPSKAHDVVPGAGIFDLEPGTEDALIPLFEQVFAGETVRQDAVQIESGGTASFWDIVLSPLYEDNQVVGIMNVSIDATERVQTEMQLKETLGRLAESESMLRSVIENAQHFVIYRVKVDVDNPYHGKVILVSPSIQELLGVDDPYDYSTWFTKLHPDDYDRVVEANRRSMEESVPYNQPARVFNEKEGRWRWVQTISNPGFDAKGNVTHFDGMIIDLTDQKEAEIALQELNATLEQRVEERTHELKRRQEIAESMRDIIGMINANIPLETFLEQAVKLATQRIGAAGCILHQFDLVNQTISQMASFGMVDVFQKPRTRNFDLLKASGGEAYLKATLQRKPTYINYAPLPERVDEVMRDPSIPDEIKAERIALRKKFAGSFSVPIYIQDNVYGGMVFYYTEPQEFTEEQIQLGLTFSEQVAVAIENARLFQEAESRRKVAESLRDTLSKINSNTSLDAVLDFIVSQAEELSDSRFIALYVFQSETGQLQAQAIKGEFPEALREVRLEAGEGTVGRAVKERRIISIPDVSKIGYAPARSDIDGNHPVFVKNSNQDALERVADVFNAVLAIPLLTQNNIYGALAFYYPNARDFQQEEIQLASAFADQAALAIENAMVRTQATEMAKLSERSRLARDLHDAVSQTLFSANLIAEVLPKLWDRNPKAGEQKLDELQLLTSGALSEMRTLLLELRPASLVDMDLEDLLRTLTDAFTGRTRVPVEIKGDGQIDPPVPVKEVFYRVAQEALNNITKHAEASQITVYLQRTEQQLQLDIQDDGRGFDPQSLSPENLGLGIMHERAETIGANLEIHSEIGNGTHIKLFWKDVQE